MSRWFNVFVVGTRSMKSFWPLRLFVLLKINVLNNMIVCFNKSSCHWFFCTVPLLVIPKKFSYFFVDHLSRHCINGMSPNVRHFFRRLKRFLPLPTVTRSNNGNDNRRSDLEISVMCYMELIAVYPRWAALYSSSFTCKCESLWYWIQATLCFTIFDCLYLEVNILIVDTNNNIVCLCSIIYELVSSVGINSLTDIIFRGTLKMGRIIKWLYIPERLWFDAIIFLTFSQMCPWVYVLIMICDLTLLNHSARINTFTNRMASK